jgi:AraC-like DNA-binding protein
LENIKIIQIIYSAASIQGIFLSVLLFRAKVNQPANRILVILLLILSFHLILVGFDNKEFFLEFPHLSRISWIIGTLYWPLLYLFVQYITQTQPKKIWTSLWTLIPFVVFFIIMLPYYSLSVTEKRIMLSDFEQVSQSDFGWINQTISVLHIFFQVYLLIYYLRYEQHLKDEFSEVESLRIKWLKQFLIISFGVTFLSVISFFARSWEIPVLSRLYSFHFIGIVLLFYWLSYKALTHPTLFGIVKEVSHKKPETQDKVDSEKYKKSSLAFDDIKIIYDKVKQILEEQKLYTKNDLTLSELALKTGLQKHSISQAINSSGSGNFFDLINHYRLEEFKRLAKSEDKKHLNLLGIAQEAGFNSKASFYAVFKKKTGMTPTEYLELES